MAGRPKLMEHEKVMTPEEKEIILAYITVPDREFARSSAIIRLILKTGLRVNEVSNLQIKHLILEGERPMVCVWGGKKRRPDQVDIVKICKETAAYLTGYLQRACPKEYVFEGKGHKLSRNALWTDVKKVYAALGLNPKYAVHSLRHRFITDTYKAFRDPVITMNQARHLNLSVTTRYIHLATEESQEFRDKLKLV